MRRILISSAVTAGLLAAAVSPASAHARLKSAVPGIGASVHAPPKTIELTFSEGVVPKFSGIELTDAAGKPVPLGAAAASAGKAALSVPIAATLAPGVYTVTWHAVAADTHRTKGSFRFTLAP